MAGKKAVPVIVYVPSARCGKSAVFETARFAESVEHKLGVKVVRLERQLAYDLNPDISEEAAEEFCQQLNDGIHQRQGRGEGGLIYIKHVEVPDFCAGALGILEKVMILLAYVSLVDGKVYS